MSQPMLSLKPEAPSGNTPKTTPHLLPCRVHHTGSVDPVQSFWDPKADESKDYCAFFSFPGNLRY